MSSVRDLQSLGPDPQCRFASCSKRTRTTLSWLFLTANRSGVLRAKVLVAFGSFEGNAEAGKQG